MVQFMQFLGLKCEEFCEQDYHKVYLYMHEEEEGKHFKLCSCIQLTKKNKKL